MEDFDYPEIQALRALYQKHPITIRVSETECLAGNSAYPKVELSIGENAFSLYADDEYHDFKIGNPLLSFCIILRELEGYAETEDFLAWCKDNGSDASHPEIRDYHMKLGALYSAIEKILGEIDCQISDYDFALNAGAAQALRSVDPS